jgi:hypothetical protein
MIYLKRLFVAVAALAVFASAFAQGAPKATGSVGFDFFGGVANVAFNAHDGGDFDKGWMDWMTVGGLYPHMFGGPVVDAVVDTELGIAYFDVVVAYSDPYPYAVGGTIRIWVTDGGNPGYGNDTFAYQWLDVPQFGTAIYGPVGVMSGNLKVHTK